MRPMLATSLALLLLAVPTSPARPQSPTTLSITDPGAPSAGRTFAAVVPATDPQHATLGSPETLAPPYIHFAVRPMNAVARLSIVTGEKVWQRPSFGSYPGSIAVAEDGTVWVGNECLVGGRDNDPTCSNVVHLDNDGNLIARADIPGWVRGVAIDEHGDVWAGTYNGQRIWKISGAQVDGSQMPPRAQILGNWYVAASIYGVAVDGRGILWTASTPAKRFDTRTETWTTVTNPSYGGVAIDGENRVWFGAWYGQGTMHRLLGDPPHTLLNVPGTPGAVQVVVHPDGTVWGGSYCQAVCSQRGAYKVTLSADGSAVAETQFFADPEGASNFDINVDRAGYLWSSKVWNQGYVNRWNLAGTRLTMHTVEPGLDVHQEAGGDATGVIHRTITARRGTWTQVVDAGAAAPAWTSLGRVADVPPDSYLEPRVRAAAAPEGPWGAWQPLADAATVDLTGVAAIQGLRYLAVEYTLGARRWSVKPTLEEVHVGLTTVGVAEAPGAARFGLGEAVPNPTAGATTLEFWLPRAARIRLEVLDVQGREVATLADGDFAAGRHQASWDGRSGAAAAPAGLYLVRYRTPAGEHVRRLVLAR